MLCSQITELPIYDSGVQNNSRTRIYRPDKISSNVNKSHEPLQCTTMDKFWLSWANETVQVGRGHQLGQSEFITLIDSKSTSKNFLAVSTGFGASGYWIFHSGKEFLEIDVNTCSAFTNDHIL